MKLVEGGFIKQWASKLIPRAACDESTLSGQAIGIHEMAGSFLILCIGLMLSMTALVGEVMLHTVNSWKKGLTGTSQTKL